jgi:hypothetical protein
MKPKTTRRRTIGANPLDALIPSEHASVTEPDVDAAADEEQLETGGQSDVDAAADEEQLETGGQPDQASEPSGQYQATSTQRLVTGRQRPVTSQQPPLRRGFVQRAKGGPRVRITTYVPPEAGEKLRRWCFDQGLVVSDVCSKEILRFVAKLPDK